MAIYQICYTETNTHYFGVEASSEAEARKRFDDWRNCDDHVYDTMREGWNIESECMVMMRREDNNGFFADDDVLTEEMYQAL